MAQDQNNALELEFSFDEYMGYVKKHHPILKQANLKLSVSEANLLKSRGGFDPKIEVDYDRKKFMNTEYYDQFNSVFKIPTWYGIEFKANYEDNSGVYLNPELTVPEGGLYSAGVSFSLAQGFLINERMAALKKAKLFVSESTAKRDLIVNDLIYDASIAYFEWLETYQELSIYQRFLNNAQIRFEGIKRQVEFGDKAAIDSVEAKITLQNRKLNLEMSRLKSRKAILKVSNYLWMNNMPLDMQEYLIPLLPGNQELYTSLVFDNIETQNTLINEHPKLKTLEAQIGRLKIDRSLKRNALLPRIDLQYNFLTTNINQFDNFNTANYKASVNFSLPLFLRKERGNYKLSKLKLMDANYEFDLASVIIKNKVNAVYAEINSLEKQNKLIESIVSNYNHMLDAEERKFQLGESSVFLINSREQKLITAELKFNILTIKKLKANADLHNTLGVSSSIHKNETSE